MGFRFRKSIRLLPGVRLNLSKTGFSTSIGGNGAIINVGKRGVRGTAGIPGTGLSYSQQLLSNPSKPAQSAQPIAPTPASAASSRSFSPLVGLAAFFGVGFCAYMGSDQTSDTAPQQLASPVPDGTTEMIVNAPNLNCRANPGVRSQIVAQFTKGSVVSVAPVDVSGWRWVVTAGENGCWVSTQYLSEPNL